MSLRMSVVRTYLARRPNRLRTAESARAVASAHAPAPPVPRRLARRHEVTTATVDGFEVLTLVPRTGPTGAEILYLHGGGFINELQTAHWSIVEALARRTDATITVPLYGLAPEHTAAEAIALVREVHARILHRSPGATVHVAGDSAGGTLALSLAITLRDEGGSPPAGLFLFSPWLDLTMSNPAAAALVPLDVMLDVPGLAWCAEQWARSSSLDDPQVNPMADHLGGLPPTYVYQGAHDIFLADALAFTDRAVRAGSPVDLHVHPGGFHVYVAATFTPEAKEVFAHVAQVVRKGR